MPRSSGLKLTLDGCNVVLHKSPNTYAAFKRIETEPQQPQNLLVKAPPIPMPRSSGLKHKYFFGPPTSTNTPNTYAAFKRIET